MIDQIINRTGQILFPDGTSGSFFHVWNQAAAADDGQDNYWDESH